jgi:hypothetical protein
MEHFLMADDILTELHANAWCGEEANGSVSDEFVSWGVHPDLPQQKEPLAPIPLDLANWTDLRVGWGVVVPDRDDLSAIDKAQGIDLAEPIKELISSRGNAPVFRYNPIVRAGYLRRYRTDGNFSDFGLGGERGIGDNAVPYYMLIVGSPKEIPWSVQIGMQTDAFVGRLDLDSEGLKSYVQALLLNWNDDTNNRKSPVIWATDHGHPDITRLMRKTITDPLVKRFIDDPEFKMDNGYAVGADASHDQLLKMLKKRNPAFVLTSSHGTTFPLNDLNTMSAHLGLPVDNGRHILNIDKLVNHWSPYGAIWYSHACCSAGSDSTSRFSGIVGSNSSLGRTLDAITQVGALQASLPKSLLGGSKPLRCFIGHVEPTFSWTLCDPINSQVTTAPIIDALYGELHLASAPPVGFAMRRYFHAVAGLLQMYTEAINEVHAHQPDAKGKACRAKLMAIDRLSMVILGDPTVSLPRLLV